MRIVAVGDVMLQRLPALLQATAPEQSGLRELLRDADLRIGNLEQCLSHRGSPRDKFITIRAAPDLAVSVRDLGFDVMGVANNHAWDYGEEAFFDTLQACKTAGLRTVGGGATLAEAFAPATLDVRGNAVAVIACSASLPPDSAAGPNKAGIAPVRVTTSYEIDPIYCQEQPGTAPRVRTTVLPIDACDLLAAVENARTNRCFVIVLLHWGAPPYWHAPFDGELLEYQRPLAQAVAQAGADVILGAHPHVIQGAESIGSCLVFYSLGNFMFHKRDAGARAADPVPGYRMGWRDAFAVSAQDARKRDSMLARLTVNDRLLQDASIFPVVLDEMGEPALASGMRRAEIINKFEVSSKVFGTPVSVEGGSVVVQLDAVRLKG